MVVGAFHYFLLFDQKSTVFVLLVVSNIQREARGGGMVPWRIVIFQCFCILNQVLKCVVWKVIIHYVNEMSSEKIWKIYTLRINNFQLNC